MVRVVRVLFGVYMAAVLVVTLWPSPQTTDAPRWTQDVLALLDRVGLGMSVEHLEMAANVVMFLPFGFLLMLILGMAPRPPQMPARARRPLFEVRPLLHAFVLTTVAAVLVSGGIEVVQTVIPGRVPTVQDVALNVAGAVLGALVVGPMLALARRVPALRRRAQAGWSPAT
ncbi:VanZ like protein [Sediminihabitans luteus]|uniref:VanZ like protein n=1 Tax=Sediminihabitans luteus TaxID=1138585 RepID=A0A2M9CBY5_9CELL|nr:VanZ family protein [Sediminihabitans luteus]PJJ68557.1 VanZ like protein [Sediminihabitans luteus]GII99892.1 hypothetical protein Slu03_22700 [Sediminihabitans luteus]